MELPIPEPAARVIERLYSHGYEAYAVGGCVRDTLIGRIPNDWDVTTSAPPERLLTLFDSPLFKAIPTGIAHGTVTVLSSGEAVEVTTFRVDGEYSDSRRPDKVSFTSSLGEDLARRDFTINAMAYSPHCGLVDLYGGRADLDNKLIRCVGEPERRFSEDALRILRAPRFASVLDFGVEDATASAALSLRGRLDLISKERICSELAKLISGEGVSRVLCQFRPIIGTILPELMRDEYDRAASYVGRLGGSPIALQLAALFYGISPETARGALTRLRFDKRTCSRTAMILSHIGANPASKSDVKRLASEVGTDCAGEIIALGELCGTASPECAGYLGEIRENDECISVSGLKINGDDLLALGVRPKQIGSLLSRLLGEVIDGRIPNERQALEAFIRDFLQA